MTTARPKTGSLLRGAATIALVAALGIFGVRAKDDIYAWIQEQARPKENATAVVSAGGRKPLMPLHDLIPQCQKKGAGYHACMFEAGYAVNAQWTTAHNNDARNDPGNAGSPGRAEATKDPYREGPSPLYKVPYWVARE